LDGFHHQRLNLLLEAQDGNPRPSLRIDQGSLRCSTRWSVQWSEARMTQVSFGNGIKLEQVSEIEVGGEGVRVTFVDGQRKFIEGEGGFELYRKWIELKDGDKRWAREVKP